MIRLILISSLSVDDIPTTKQAKIQDYIDRCTAWSASADSYIKCSREANKMYGDMLE